MLSCVEINSFNGQNKLQEFIAELIEKAEQYSNICIVCIGTDRCTGDSLGPLIGHKLQDLKSNRFSVHGTLDSPIHAKNLDDVVKKIHKEYTRPFIIAIDACLGKMEHVGYITVEEGPIKPGSGLGKDLPPIGNMSITGIVNISGFMDFIMLQSTSLGFVMKMADMISGALRSIIKKYEYSNAV